MILGALGLGLALLAITRDDRRITWVAIGVLVIALALRFLQPPGERGRR
jgi:hypothetical protein